MSSVVFLAVNEETSDFVQSAWESPSPTSTLLVPRTSHLKAVPLLIPSPVGGVHAGTACPLQNLLSGNKSFSPKPNSGVGRMVILRGLLLQPLAEVNTTSCCAEAAGSATLPAKMLPWPEGVEEFSATEPMRFGVEVPAL